MENPFVDISVLPVEERTPARKNLERSLARDQYIVQSNDIISKAAFKKIEFRGNSRKYSLSLVEQKIIRYLMSLIKPTETEIHPQIVDIKELCEICGMDTTENRNRVQQVKDAISNIESMRLWLNKKDVTRSISWIAPYTEIYPRTGKMKISLEPALSDFYIAQRGNYTQYQLHDIIKAKCKHTIPLYELLKSLSYKGNVIVFDVDDLRAALDCISYKNFANFRKKVLDPAIEDINKYTMLKIEDYGNDPKDEGKKLYFRPIKEGKTITHIEFSIRNIKADGEEGQRRYENVEREINPDQYILDGYYGGAL